MFFFLWAPSSFYPRQMIICKNMIFINDISEVSSPAPNSLLLTVVCYHTNNGGSQTWACRRTTGTHVRCRASGLECPLSLSSKQENFWERKELRVSGCQPVHAVSSPRPHLYKFWFRGLSWSQGSCTLNKPILVNQRSRSSGPHFQQNWLNNRKRRQ